MTFPRDASGLPARGTAPNGEVSIVKREKELTTNAKVSAPTLLKVLVNKARPSRITDTLAGSTYSRINLSEKDSWAFRFLEVAYSNSLR